MNAWRKYVTLGGSRRVMIGMIISLSIGMVPLTLQLVTQELIDRVGATVALGAADIADKLDVVLSERLGDIQGFAQAPLLIRRDPAQLQAYLENIRRIYPLYRQLSIVDRQGHVVASTDRVAPATVVSPSLLRATLHHPGPQVEVVRRADHPGGSLIAVRFAMALHASDRDPQGAIITELDQHTLRALATQTTQHQQLAAVHPAVQDFWVLSPAGDVLLTSRDESNEEPAPPLGLPSAMMAQEGKSGYVEEQDTSGRNALTGYARMAGLPLFPEMQWSVLVRVDRTQVWDSIWSVLWKLVGIGGVCLAPPLGLFYWARRRQAAEESQAALARRALEANEARIRKIVDIALDAVIIIDAEGTVTEWNPQAEKTFGYTRAEALGNPLTTLIIPPAYRDAHMKGLRRYVTTGEHTILNRRIEISALHQDGHELPIELAVIPLHVGEQLSFCAFLREITERKRAEEELRGSKAFLDSVVDNLPTMVFIKEAKDLRFVRLNKAGEELIGCSQVELLGKSDHDLFPKEQAEFFTRHDRTVLASGCLHDIPEEPIQTKEKGTRFLHTKKIPILDGSGQPQYLLGISEDITERKRAEDALRHSQEAAEAANKAKSEFLANVSHEIRTPLNAVLGTLELLAETAATDEQREYAAMGKRAGTVLLHLVNDLLDMAKAEAGTLRIESHPFDVREIARRVHDMMAGRAQAKGLALRVAIGEAVPARIEGDATRLQQVLLNLIGNAVKFTERGHVTLTVSTAPEGSPPGPLQFAVSDSGIGIPHDQTGAIFERFTQIDSGDNRKYGGTGLGLSICRQLVNLMGGRIWVESEPGHGSRFMFTLPCQAASAAPRLRAAQEPRGGTTRSAMPARELDGPHILIVDDFPETLQLAKAYLLRHPCQVDLAENGQDALARCRLYRYDVVLMDMQMPEMDGYATTAALRAWEQEHGLPPVPVVAMTADVRAEARTRSRASGCTEFLGKPFTKHELLAAIQHCIGQPAGAVASTTMPMPADQEWIPFRRAFLQNRREELPILAEAFAAGDFNAIATIGHRIKGLAGSYGFTAIGEVAAALEQAAREQQAEAVERGLQRLTGLVMATDETSGQAA